MTDQGNVTTEQVNNLHEAIKEENKGRIGLLELINRLTVLGNVTADQISILNEAIKEVNEAIKEEAKLLKAMVVVAEAKKADINTKDVDCLFFWWKATVVAVAVAAAAAAVGLKLWAQK